MFGLFSSALVENLASLVPAERDIYMPCLYNQELPFQRKLVLLYIIENLSLQISHKSGPESIQCNPSFVGLPVSLSFATLREAKWGKCIGVPA